MFKIIQSAGVLGSLLRKIAGLLKKVAVPLVKDILAPLGMTAAALEINSEILKNTRFWNEEINDTLKNCWSP